ncbi:BTB/POZ domain-containing protein 9-like [Tropilaelaps mercedesae]|uniref:BTB/POZ domain-containing protein 9-like n=1 Tax=Tropilaelaps mercedesae TaxID=418985 RepID=A0A1V9XIJ5_9ACAR|nr:BTB/POZ domain-containing protein 9-like [Tropilaelaps mercedesae]
MLSHNSLCAKEVDIFEAVYRWYVDKDGHVPAEIMSEILDQVRLPLMGTTDLLGLVRRSKLFHPDCLLGAIKTKKECLDVDLNYRGQLVIDENVATAEHGAQVLTGE